MARKTIKPVFSRPREISRIPGRLARSPLSLYSKSAKRKLCVCAYCALASAGLPVQVVDGGHRNDFIDFFLPAFVNSQIAQVNRPKILERMVTGSSLLCSEVFVTCLFFFIFKLRTYKILSLSGVK